MNIFGVHICSDEILQLQAILPFAQNYIAQISAWLQKVGIIKCSAVEKCHNHSSNYDA